MHQPFIKTCPNILLIAIFSIATLSPSSRAKVAIHGVIATLACEDAFSQNGGGGLRHIRQVIFEVYDMCRQRGPACLNGKMYNFQSACFLIPSSSPHVIYRIYHELTVEIKIIETSLEKCY